MVVKNLLEDIAASGGVQEAQAAGDLKTPNGPPPPRTPSPSRANAPAPIAPVRPAITPQPSMSGAPRTAPKPIVPGAAAPGAGSGMSAEELLFDVESSVPAKKIASPPPPPPAAISSRPPPAPSSAAIKSSAPKVIHPIGPPPPPGAAKIANAPPPPSPPTKNGTPAGLRAGVAGRSQTNGGRTAEELLESLEEEERSSSGPKVDFKGSLWEDEDEQGTPTPH